MRFEIIPNDSFIPIEGINVGYLWEDNWNDWWKYKTLYHLTYFDSDGIKHDIGSVKIGQFAMIEDQKKPALPDSFEALDDNFFSLGQDADYYKTIMELGDETARIIINSLNDIAANINLYKRSLAEDVTGESLLRSVSPVTIEGQFRRILNGDAILTPYQFEYRGPKPRIENIEPIQLDIQVAPDSKPPTNIHVLIGRNGVGKTYLLNAMTRALVTNDPDDESDGIFNFVDRGIAIAQECQFASILSISFSAFDDFEFSKVNRNVSNIVRYTNVGLRKRVKNKEGEWVVVTRSPQGLAKDFSLSARLCVRGIKEVRWRKALTTLEADPIFAEAEIASLSSIADVGDNLFSREAGSLFKKLSSGHKIVLLTITKLVEQVEEKTLVLIDEPEAHLHPPLLSAFIRALSDLLINRNGVAIIATHSPVVLQEVPTSCVWRIVRHGHAAKASRPRIETFAENVGVLTSEVFGLEVTKSGFHKMLYDATNNESEIQNVLRKFDFKVGAEGRALISSALANQNNNGVE